jgi:ribosomal-protein-alanine N-acetyltransferase
MTTDSASTGGLPIVTDRLTIRPLQVSDVESMHAVYSDPEATRYVPGGVRDLDGTRRRVADLMAHHDRFQVSKWAVTLTNSKQLIGDCGLQFLPNRPELELGFHFAREYWGHGYATEAATACLAWALANRDERIVAVVEPDHKVSQRVLEKIGFRPIGREFIIDRAWQVYEADR